MPTDKPVDKILEGLTEFIRGTEDYPLFNSASNIAYTKSQVSFDITSIQTSVEIRFAKPSEIINLGDTDASSRISIKNEKTNQAFIPLNVIANDSNQEFIPLEHYSLFLELPQLFFRITNFLYSGEASTIKL